MVNYTTNFKEKQNQPRIFTPEEIIERRRRWIKLDYHLGKKYRTPENHFSHKKVGFIRSIAIGRNLTRKQLMKVVEKMMYKPDKKRKHEISWYLHLYGFLKNCSEEIWKDLIQNVE